MYAWVDEISARLLKTEKFDGRRRRDLPLYLTIFKSFNFEDTSILEQWSYQ